MVVTDWIYVVVLDGYYGSDTIELATTSLREALACVDRLCIEIGGLKGKLASFNGDGCSCHPANAAHWHAGHTGVAMYWWPATAPPQSQP